MAPEPAGFELPNDCVTHILGVHMDWHFSNDGDAQAGPVPQTEFDTLVQTGKVNASTLVWHAGMPNWVRYSELATGSGGVLTATGGMQRCAECGQTFPEADMISFGSSWVCAGCKPRFVQKLKEGVAPAGTLNYAGFWVRVGAKFIDGIILEVINIAAGIVIGLTLRGTMQPNLVPIIGGLVGLIFGIAYTAGFNGRFGATPGKMALNLKIVRPDGEPISYARALGRYFAEILSGVIFGIGFMMAGWDEQKRALHDRICDTRVIRR